MLLPAPGMFSTTNRTSSSYAGFLFIAAPSSSSTQVTNIQGGGTMNMEGMLYMPKQTVYVTGNGAVNASTKLFGMVAKNFDFQGNGTFKFSTLTSGATVPDILPTEPANQVLGTVALK